MEGIKYGKKVIYLLLTFIFFIIYNLVFDYIFTYIEIIFVTANFLLFLIQIFISIVILFPLSFVTTKKVFEIIKTT